MNRHSQVTALDHRFLLVSLSSSSLSVQTSWTSAHLSQCSLHLCNQEGTQMKPCRSVA